MKGIQDDSENVTRFVVLWRWVWEERRTGQRLGAGWGAGRSIVARHQPPVTLVWPLPSLFATCRDPLITFDGDSTPHKTSIVFSLGDGPGQLFKGEWLNKCGSVGVVSRAR